MSLYDVCNAAGGMTAYEWERDPKRLAFILARYKFVAKMFAGKDRVLEVGCSDGFGSRLVRQAVNELTAIDIDGAAIEIAKKQNGNSNWAIDFRRDDFSRGNLLFVRDAVFCLDVIEHIPAADAGEFLKRLSDTAPVCIIGTPSLSSQVFASELSKQGHVNCYTGDALKQACERFWSQAFIFCMNDEVLHTGFHPMAQYYFALCVR